VSLTISSCENSRNENIETGGDTHYEGGITCLDYSDPSPSHILVKTKTLDEKKVLPSELRPLHITDNPRKKRDIPNQTAQKEHDSSSYSEPTSSEGSSSEEEVCQR